ncbi:hypothetical protein VNO78_20288 [Psophocarpus tetragonolobus]|uniref:Uncharacterized protein n=1 Tax=Psophocarpus tetragonolobus TaxID=3891 RepID=A0AAN9SB24_PSOTE
MPCDVTLMDSHFVPNISCGHNTVFLSNQEFNMRLICLRKCKIREQWLLAFDEKRCVGSILKSAHCNLSYILTSADWGLGGEKRMMETMFSKVKGEIEVMGLTQEELERSLGRETGGIKNGHARRKSSSTRIA